jgi:hypothetical protein
MAALLLPARTTECGQAGRRRLSSITFAASGGPNVGFDAASYGLASAASVPEPATLLLLGTGLGAVAARRRSKKRA